MGPLPANSVLENSLKDLETVGENVTSVAIG